MSKVGAFTAAILIGFAGVAFAASDADLQPVPKLATRVTDVTATLDAAQRSSLDDRLAALEQRKGAQIAVLMVPTTAPESIEQYATRVFDAWKLGRKGVDDGALVLVAKNDHRVRIEVAYGLEGAIPDAAAKRVAHDYMSPKFAKGDFADGIGSGIDALVALIDDEPLPPLPSAPAPRRNTVVVSDWWSPVFIVAGLILGGVSGVILLLVFGRPRVHRALLGRVPERARPFAIGAVNGLLIGFFMRNPLAALAALAAGASLASVAGLAHTPLIRRRGHGGTGGSSSSGDSGSSGSSSSGGSSGSSGGDFSGGGGSSGGGGASDSW